MCPHATEPLARVLAQTFAAFGDHLVGEKGREPIPFT